MRSAAPLAVLEIIQMLDMEFAKINIVETTTKHTLEIDYDKWKSTSNMHNHEFNNIQAYHELNCVRSCIDSYTHPMVIWDRPQLL